MKLLYFGLATRYKAGAVLQGRCGTKTFTAPELVLREGYGEKQADVWNRGMLLHFITTTYDPFRGSTPKETEGNIIKGTYDIPAHASGQLENLIHQMLTVVPERRPSIEDLQQHPSVMKCEETTPSDTYPDPNILDILSDLGFDANAILESLQKRKCDEVVRAYLIKEQVHKGLERGCTTSVKPAASGPTPPPSPAHPSVSGLHLKQRTREPIFGLFQTQPS